MMKKHFTALLFISFLGVGSSAPRLSRVKVRLMNQLGSGRTLEVHCKSKDDDLGHSTLRDEAELSWSFHPNLWGTTLFYCNVEWDNGNSNCYRFDAYDHNRDYRRCWVECRWMITSNGTLSGFDERSGYWEPFSLRKGNECRS